MMNACDRAFQWPMALHLLREMSHQRLQGCQLSMGRWDRDLVLVGYMDPFNGWKLLTRGGYVVIFCGGPGKTMCFIWLFWPSNRWQFIWFHGLPVVEDWQIMSGHWTQYFFLIIVTLHLHAFAQMVCVLCQQFRRVHHLQKRLSVWTWHRLLLATESENCICNVHDGWRSRSTSTSWLLHTWHSSRVLTGHMKLPWGILYSNIEYYNIQPWHVPVLQSVAYTIQQKTDLVQQKNVGLLGFLWDEHASQRVKSWEDLDCGALFQEMCKLMRRSLRIVSKDTSVLDFEDLQASALR